MYVYLLRHGKTKFNIEKRYQGSLDIPLCEQGKDELIQADFSPKIVYITPLKRTKQTAQIIFPQSEYIEKDDFREMNFGIFEGKNYIEMQNNEDYRNWVDSGCISKCPMGESKEEFSARVCKCFEKLMKSEIQKQSEQTVILAHGGTQMSIMERFALPEKSYYEWASSHSGGYLLELDKDMWRERRKMIYINTVSFKKGNAV